ncbi:hypothetical protein N0V88_002100 [Collariella sp. IMI 366227]|nr:hypothetical protein N0V88_002100 [Collariella sp. IMI 366227]
MDGHQDRPTLQQTPGSSLRRSEEWMRKKRQTDDEENTWTNDQTCGWIAGSSSAAFICATTESCATDKNNVVGCTSEGMKEDPFFTVCYDYQAVEDGLCSSAGTKTGCCVSSTRGACITYVWPGATPKSMYRCYTKQEIITMLDEPQFVIDDRTRTTSSPSSSTSVASSTTEAPGAQSTTPIPDDDDDKNTSGGNNTGAIVGGVVGGVAGIALIAGLIAFLIIRNRNNKEKPNPGAGTAYSAVAPGDPSYPPPPPATHPPPGLLPTSLHGPSTLNPSGTPYLTQTHTPPAGAAAAAYDPRQSYYEPGKMGATPPGGHMSPPVAGYAPYPGGTTPPGQQGMYGAPTPPGQQGAYGAPGAYPPPQAQQVHMAELDTTALPSGHVGNPVEMAAVPHTDR